MEIGTTIISTQEYMELRAMKDNLEARKAEIEANADKVLYTQRIYLEGDCSREKRFIGKDEALRQIQQESDDRDPAKISRTLPARLHFLFTGNLTKVKE